MTRDLLLCRQWFLLITVPWLLAGCGEQGKPAPKVVPVSGKVTYNAQPVKDATVTFINDQSPRTATGVTDANGEFQLTTFDTNDGAIPGEHKIAIALRPAVAGAGTPNLTSSQRPEDMKAYMEQMKAVGQNREAPKSQLPAKYASAQTSDLKREVVEGEQNKFTFDLTD